jgi:glycosyltransferase involved in cell wall biosynthesis
MRVALVTDGIWPYVLGGMQKHSYYLCRYLARRGVQVDLYHYNRSSYDISALEFFGAEEKRFITSIIVDFPEGIKFPGHYLLRSWQHSCRIYSAMADRLHTYDFIYTKGFTGWKLLKQKQGGALKCAPVGVKFHGYEMFQKPPDVKTWLQFVLLLRRPVRSVSRMADVVFSYGGKITELIRRTGVPDRRIFELPSGVEFVVLARTAPITAGRLKFVFVGRYERRKGIEEYNTAISALPRGVAEFHFIGPIPDAKRLNLPDVHYHGEIRDRDQLNTLIRKCDVLVCPSWSEGMPNVILEGMSQGLAVLATDVGAVNVLVNGETGWLMSSPSPDAIAQSILQITRLPAEAISTKKAAALRLVTEHFTWDTLIDRLITRIRQLTSAAPRH